MAVHDATGCAVESVNDVIWPWRKEVGGESRGFSIAAKVILQMAVMSLIAGVFFFRGHNVMGWAVAGLALFFLALACLSASAYRWFDQKTRVFGLWVGIGITHIMLVPFYFLCFMPAAIVLRIRKKDIMRLAFPSASESCWSERAASFRVEQYKRQY